MAQDSKLAICLVFDESGDKKVSYVFGFRDGFVDRSDLK